MVRMKISDKVIRDFVKRYKLQLNVVKGETGNYVADSQVILTS